MNVLNAEVIEEIGKFVEHVATDAAIKGAVITSGKEGFSGGADLSMLQRHGRGICARSPRPRAKKRR